jgi:hypothetical protein
MDKMENRPVPLGIIKTFLLTCPTKGLAWETSGVEIYLRAYRIIPRGDVWVKSRWVPV